MGKHPSLPIPSNTLSQPSNGESTGAWQRERIICCCCIRRQSSVTAGRSCFLPRPANGKSTLCTALVHSGWRLLSDEFGLVRPEDGLLLPIPRLIPLKNESIDVIRRFRPEAIIGPSFLATRKGTVAHVQPPLDSIRRAQEPARPRWLIFPRWVSGAPLTLEPMSRSQAFLMVATNAFNYEVLDETAFRLVTDMVRACDCYSLVYSDLNEAIPALDELCNSMDD
jgi:HprK-related kinase A